MSLSSSQPLDTAQSSHSNAYDANPADVDDYNIQSPLVSFERVGGGSKTYKSALKTSTGSIIATTVTSATHHSPSPKTPSLRPPQLMLTPFSDQIGSAHRQSLIDKDRGADGGSLHRTRKTAGKSTNSSSLFFHDRQTMGFLLDFLEKANIPPWVTMTVAVGIPIIGLIVFATLFGVKHIDEWNNALWVEDYVPLATPLLRAVHEAQKERGLTGRFMSQWALPSDNVTLSKQRLLTSAAWGLAEEALRALPSSIRNRDRAVDAMSGVIHLDVVREKVSANRTSAWDIFDVYTQQIYRFLDVVGLMGDECPVERTARLLGQLMYLSSMKEYMGQCRGLGMIILRPPSNVTFYPENKDLLPVYALEQIIAIERDFVTSADKVRVALYREIVNSVPEFTEMRETVQSLRFGGNLANGNATEWWRLTTKAIGALVRIEQSMIDEFVADAGSARTAATNAIVAIVIAVVVAVVPAALVVFVSTRTYNDLREERHIGEELIAAVAHIAPIELYVALQVDIQTLTPGQKKGMAVTFVSFRFTNFEEISKTDGDNELFAAGDAMYQTAVRLASENEGFVMSCCCRDRSRRRNAPWTCR
eukprot:PhM_4_TR18617/c0_g1_i2/m.83714